MSLLDDTDFPENSTIFFGGAVLHSSSFLLLYPLVVVVVVVLVAVVNFVTPTSAHLTRSSKKVAVGATFGHQFLVASTLLKPSKPPGLDGKNPWNKSCLPVEIC